MKKTLIKPSAAEDALITAAAMSDPDALPYTDAEWEKVRPLLKRGRGRPAGSGNKVQVSLRLDADVLDALRATGSKWQTRANDVLRDWISRHPV
jgi:uncharacterized protein (DUF4415 family)